MDEEEAVAIMMANLKGRKNKPSNLIDIAVACRLLRDKWGFPEMSRYFKISQYMLRQIDKINDLNSELKRLVKDGKLGIEASYHLWRLDEKQRAEAAKIMQEMSTDDIRTFVYFLRHNKGISIEEAKHLFEKSKPEKIRMLVLPLDSEQFRKLEASAQRSKLGIHDFVLKLIEENTND